MRSLQHPSRFTNSYFHLFIYSLVPGLVFLVSVMQPQRGSAQETPADSLTGSSICTFDDGKQVSTRYKPVAVSGSQAAAMGKVWAPGGAALTLFTETGIKVGNVSIPAGAYTMYFLPSKKAWTLIVSRNVSIDGSYDKNQDLARANMELGELPHAEDELKVFFGHTGPKRCEINVDYGKSRAWTDITQN